ncbi:MAG: hypothetical protein KF708_20845 [Pirellulales bacterium]|nr:hypothetical protein [Pirellulales bacterium]
MNRGKNIAVVLCLMAMASFISIPMWNWLTSRAASAKLQARTKTLVDRNPQLELAWKVAMLDDVLSYAEAKALVEAAGEQVDPNE